MKRVRVFDHLEELDAFVPTEEYRAIADDLGLSEWSPVVWIGRLFALDNDFGEHWFDNWDAREALAERAMAAGFDPESLLIIDPGRFRDGRDGPCHSDAIRKAFWHDVLNSLELSTDLLFAAAIEFNEALRARADEGDQSVASQWIHDLDDRIEHWTRQFSG